MSDSERLTAIDARFLDIDGVLTDGTFVWSASGEESMRFSFEAVMGLSRGRRAGLMLGLISGESSALLDCFADKVGISEVSKACNKKGAALRRFAVSTGIALERIAYVGDDLNDLPVLEIAGFSLAPTNAQESVKAAVQCVLARTGDRGAVRELVEMTLAARAGATLREALG